METNSLKGVRKKLFEEIDNHRIKEQMEYISEDNVEVCEHESISEESGRVIWMNMFLVRPTCALSNSFTTVH